MKKVIALLLCVVMLLSMASAAFTDQAQIDSKYTAAVVAMSEKGIINGFTDGTFQPKGTLTRAQAAKIICVLLGAENETAKDAGFADVPATHWADKFVDYCAEKNIVAGIGNGKFNPDGKLTGFAFAKMLLVAHGADATTMTGAQWAENTEKLLNEQKKNEGVKVSGNEMTREEACQLAYNFMNAMPADYVQTTVNMQKEQNLFKTFSRVFYNDNGLNMDWAGTAFEFEAECGGDISLKYNADQTPYLQVYVDGQLGLRVHTSSGTGNTIKIAENLTPGKHVIRVVRDTDITKKGELFAVSDVIFTGKKETLKATADKSLLIEFVGDSITAGKYTEMQHESGDAIHKVTNSYAYKTAEALDADFSILARGGCGYFRVSTCPKTMNQLYPYYNGFAEKPMEYKPARQADVVVIAMGTNDGSTNVKESYENGTVPFATMEEAMTDLVKQVRAMHGKDVKIVLLYGMMATSWIGENKRVAEAEGLFRKQVSTDNSGGNNHPSTEGHQKNADQLVKYLQKDVLK